MEHAILNKHNLKHGKFTQRTSKSFTSSILKQDCITAQSRRDCARTEASVHAAFGFQPNLIKNYRPVADRAHTRCERTHTVQGQISIEFLLIVSLMLLFISTIILPNVELASSVTKEVAGLSQTDIAAEKIVETANYVALSSENARQTIRVYVPKGASINCIAVAGTQNYAQIDYNYSFINSNYTVPQQGCHERTTDYCTKTFTTVLGQKFNCINFPVKTITNGTTLSIKIEKNQSSADPNGIVDINNFYG